MLKQRVSNDHNIDKCLAIEKELSSTLVKCLASYFRVCNSEKSTFTQSFKFSKITNVFFRNISFVCTEKFIHFTNEKLNNTAVLAEVRRYVNTTKERAVSP